MLVRILSLSYLIFSSVSATILSDTGCPCVQPCSSRLDWNGQVSKWCATDASCGTNQSGFAIADPCTLAGFPTLSVTSGPLYTGQNLTVNWTSHNILNETVRIKLGPTILSSINVTLETYTARVTTASVNTSIGISTISSPSVNASSSFFTVIQSSLSPLLVYNNGTFICDGRNVTITWNGTGDASYGTATVTIQRNGGGGGSTLVGTAVSTVYQGNAIILYTLPATFVPSGFGTYSARLSAIGRSGLTYTGTSSSFSLVAGPSPSSTPSSTPTITRTPTQTPSVGSSLSNTPTNTPTNTPSQTPSPTSSLTVGATPSETPTVTPTSSITSTPTASPLNYIAIAAAQTAASLATLEIAIGASIGGILILCAGSCILYRAYTRAELRKRRLQRASVSTRMGDANRLYGQGNHVNPLAIYNRR